MQIDPMRATLVALVFVVAGLVKGVTGMGLPTVAMGLLGAWLTPRQAAALLLVPSLVTNLWQLVAGAPLGALVRRLRPMMAAIALGTVAGAGALAGADGGQGVVALGGALVVYALWTLCSRPRQVPARWERRLSPWIGGATGLVTGATGVFVMPAVPWLQSLGLARDALVQALGLSFTVSTLALGTGLAVRGALPLGELTGSAAAVLPALAGMALGQALRRRIAPAAFRRGFLVALLLLGLEMALRGWR